MTHGDALPECQIIDLGRVDYETAWQIQKQYAAERGTDSRGDTFLFVEHPHTYTLGTSAHAENVLLSPEALVERGIAIHQVDRGGDVTYHGPGQIVGYPILKLAPGPDGLHADVIRYVRDLEQVLINALTGFGIEGAPYPGLTGVWVRKDETWAKIAAIGVRVTTRRVTFHGFALNVNTDLSYFGGIIPCGISDKPVTSMQALIGNWIDPGSVKLAIAQAFGQLFGYTMQHEFGR